MADLEEIAENLRDEADRLQTAIKQLDLQRNQHVIQLLKIEGKLELLLLLDKEE